MLMLFQIIINHPSEIPRPGGATISEMISCDIESNKDVTVRVIPRVIEMSESLKAFSPKRRGRYVKNERQLRYFKQYSEQKCEYECIRNATLAACGCIAFHMPSKYNILLIYYNIN